MPSAATALVSVAVPVEPMPEPRFAIPPATAPATAPATPCWTAEPIVLPIPELDEPVETEVEEEEVSAVASASAEEEVLLAFALEAEVAGGVEEDVALLPWPLLLDDLECE